MPAMADQDHGAARLRMAPRLDMDPAHERAGGVDHRKPAPGRLALDLARDPVRREDRRRPVRDLRELVDEDRALGLEVVDDLPVMDDLVAHIDRAAAPRERALDGRDRPLDAGAEAARRGEQDGERRPGRHGARPAAATRSRRGRPPRRHPPGSQRRDGALGGAHRALDRGRQGADPIPRQRQVGQGPERRLRQAARRLPDRGAPLLDDPRVGHAPGIGRDAERPQGRGDLAPDLIRKAGRRPVGGRAGGRDRHADMVARARAPIAPASRRSPRSAGGPGRRSGNAGSRSARSVPAPAIPGRSRAISEGGRARTTASRGPTGTVRSAKASAGHPAALGREAAQALAGRGRRSPAAPGPAGRDRRDPGRGRGARPGGARRPAPKGASAPGRGGGRRPRPSGC